MELDKFKCINDTFTSEQTAKILYLPKKGEVYTLIEICKTPIPSKPEGYIFQELPNDDLPDGTKISFRPSRFVPVDGNLTSEKLKESYVEGK